MENENIVKFVNKHEFADLKGNRLGELYVNVASIFETLTEAVSVIEDLIENTYDYGYGHNGIGYQTITELNSVSVDMKEALRDLIVESYNTYEYGITEENPTS